LKLLTKYKQVYFILIATLLPINALSLISIIEPKNTQSLHRSQVKVDFLLHKFWPDNVFPFIKNNLDYKCMALSDFDNVSDVERKVWEKSFKFDKVNSKKIEIKFNINGLLQLGSNDLKIKCRKYFLIWYWEDVSDIVTFKVTNNED
jgi:hypothetical protein